MEENKKKEILVTGGAGFIGSHLCKALINAGNYVICLDNLFTGSKTNISELFDNPNFEFVNHDITEPYFRSNIDEIYNLACPASPIHYQFNPIKTIKTCTIGVINMLGLAKKNNAKILQASTSEVYGDPEVHPQDEDYHGNVNPVGPRSCYDEGKRCSETLFNDYHNEHNIRIKIVRIFNTFGPKMAVNDGRVVSNFVNQALKSEKISVYGDGKQTRSFLYVDDLIEGLIKIMSLDDKFTGPVNIGTTNEISVNELALKILKLTNSSSKLAYYPLPGDDPRTRKPDLTLINQVIDWGPSVSTEEGLLKTIDYFKSIK